MKMKSTNTIRVDDFINFIPTDTYHSTASISSSFIKSTTWVSQRHSPNSTCTQNRIRDVACVGTTPSFSATCQSTLEAINTSQRLLATQVVHSSLAHGNHVCSKNLEFWIMFLDRNEKTTSEMDVQNLALLEEQPQPIRCCDTADVDNPLPNETWKLKSKSGSQWVMNVQMNLLQEMFQFVSEKMDSWNDVFNYDWWLVHGLTTKSFLRCFVWLKRINNKFGHELSSWDCIKPSNILRLRPFPNKNMVNARKTDCILFGPHKDFWGGNDCELSIGKLTNRLEAMIQAKSAYMFHMWIHLCDCDAKSLQSKLNTWFFACKIVIDFCHTVKRSMKSLFLPIPLVVRKEWKLRNKQEWWLKAETHFLSNERGFVNHFHTHDWRQHF